MLHYFLATTFLRKAIYTPLLKEVLLYSVNTYIYIAAANEAGVLDKNIYLLSISQLQTLGLHIFPVQRYASSECLHQRDLSRLLSDV